MKKFTVTRPTTLRQFTDDSYPQGSFVFSSLLRAGDVRINGVKVRVNASLKAGDEVVYYTTPKQEQMPSHSMIYADENVYVADKESGVSTEALTTELNEKGEFYPVHRLDRNTCGLLVFARNGRAEEALLQAFKKRRVEKIYYCAAKDNFKAEEGTLKAYLKKDDKRSEVYISDKPKAGWAEIVTAYKVCERRGDYAIVRVELHTGKTHQIRAHLAHIGCPVLGDEKYGDGALNAKYGVKRQLLVAKSLRFDLEGEFAYLNSLKLESKHFPEVKKK